MSIHEFTRARLENLFDGELLALGLIHGVCRWEWFHGDTVRESGELCVSGLRHLCVVRLRGDHSGVPDLHRQARKGLTDALVAHLLRSPSGKEVPHAGGG